MDADSLREQARRLGLDMARFEGCRAAGTYKGQIEEDVQAGTRAGVTGTPGFFINGIFLNGAQPASAFEKTIEAELAAMKHQQGARP